jgi:hypothetical protein
MGEGVGADVTLEGRGRCQADRDALEAFRSGRGRSVQRHGRRLQDRDRHRHERVQRVLRGCAAQGLSCGQHGLGLDIAWGLHTLPQLFPDKVLLLNDVADYLGKKYGGWTDAAAATCKQGDNWLGIPVATIGGYMTYRKSSLDKAGFKELPKDFPGFLECCKALKANNTPAGYPLGHASGDANAWLHWILWGHGAYTVDKDDKVIINSPETAKALEYCKALSETFIPGVASWNDSSNNKAFLAGELHLTNNGISIYIAAKDDPAKKSWPTIPTTPCGLWARSASRPSCSCACRSGVQVHKYPNARRPSSAFMLEKENFEKWCRARVVSHAHAEQLRQRPGVDRDPKAQVFSQASKRALPASGIGKPGEKAATGHRRLPGGRHVRQLLHRPRGHQGCHLDCRAAAEAHLSLAHRRAAGSGRPPSFATKRIRPE